MSRRTSPLRQRWRTAVLAAGLTLAAYGQAGTALAAGGSPIPEPDAPPSGKTAIPTRSTTEATPAARPAPTTRRTPLVPTPDAPVTSAKPTPQPQPQPRATAPARVPVAAAPSPPPAPVTRAAAPSRPAERTARRASPPPAKAKPRPQKTSATKKAQTTTPVTRTPHDTIRLGLPIATLAPLDEDSAASAGLLLAAAVLLAATGAGGLVVGLSARRIVSGA